MAEWQDISLSIPGLEPAQQTSGAIDTALGLVTTVMTALETLMGAVALLQNTEDVVATAIETALLALRGSLDDFLSSSAGHLLFVPPIPPFRREPARPVVPLRRLGDLVYAMQPVRSAVQDLQGDGGNYGLYRKFVESLFDAGDYARPQYRPDAYIGGVILVFGADNFAEMLSKLLRLSDIFGNSLPMPIDGYALPVPQNVKARPIAVPSHTKLSDLSVVSAAAVGGARDPYGAPILPILSEPSLPPSFGVRLQWDPPSVVTFRVDFGPWAYRIKSWHVYVKAGSRIQPGDTLSDFEVLSQTLPGAGVGTRALGISADVDVVGNVSGCVITDLDPAVTYYMSVAYTIDVEQLGADVPATTLAPALETLSTQVRVNLKEQAPYRKIQDGLPPDWMALTSPMAAFPVVQDVLAKAQAVADLVIANYADYENELSGLLQQGSDVLETLHGANAALLELLTRTSQMFSGLDVGLWGASFAGKGGVPFLIDAVGNLLLDPSTVNRPPFDRGDEAVAAIVFVTGSESAASVASFIGVLNTIFGTSPSTTVASAIAGITGTATATRESYLDAGANPTAQAPVPVPVATLESLDLGEDDPCAD